MIHTSNSTKITMHIHNEVELEREEVLEHLFVVAMHRVVVEVLDDPVR